MSQVLTARSVQDEDFSKQVLDVEIIPSVWEFRAGCGGGGSATVLGGNSSARTESTLMSCEGNINCAVARDAIRMRFFFFFFLAK